MEPTDEHTHRISPEELGPYAAEVQEVVAASLSLFRRPDPWQQPKNTVIVGMMPETSEYHGPGNLHPSRSEGPAFLDLIENDVGDAYAELHGWHSGVIYSQPYAESSSRLFDDGKLQKVIFENIPPELQVYRYWILDHLVWICLYRSAFGKRTSLLESMFQVYRSGGFPFGFRYDGQNGVELLAYYPWSAGAGDSLAEEKR